MALVNYDNLEDGNAASANDINQRFGDVIAQVNGGLDGTNIKTGSLPASVFSGDIFQKMYPIGSVYMNATDNTNPGDLLGFGTWVAFGAGRVPVGIDTGQTEFNAPEKTGGHKALQSHSHTGSTSTNGDHNHTIAFHGSTSSITPGTDLKGINWPSDRSRTTGNAGSHSHTFTTNNTGDGDSGNLQPYITVYMWVRRG